MRTANFGSLNSDGLGKQCTHVETDEIRYVYVPIDKLTLVLITTKQSNIVEDLEVLRQLNSVVVQLCNQSKLLSSTTTLILINADSGCSRH